MGIKLVAVRKDAEGNIIQFLTDEDVVISFQEAKDLARGGKLDSLTDISTDGSWIIDSSMEYMEGSNLGDLPDF